MVVSRSASLSAINIQGAESSGRAEKQGAEECLAIPLREQFHSNFNWNQSFWERNGARDGATDPSCPSLYSKTTLDSNAQPLEDARRPAPHSEVRGTIANGLAPDQKANPDPMIAGLQFGRQRQSVVSGSIDGHHSVPKYKRDGLDGIGRVFSEVFSQTATGHDQPTPDKAEGTPRADQDQDQDQDQDGLHSRSLDSYPFSFETMRDSLAAVKTNEEVDTYHGADSNEIPNELVTACRSESDNGYETDSCSEGDPDDSPSPFGSTLSDTPGRQQDISRSSSARASRGWRLVNWILKHQDVVLLRGSQPKLTTSAGYTTSAGSAGSAWGISGPSQSSTSNTGLSGGVGDKRQFRDRDGNGNAPGGQGGGDPKRLRMAGSQETGLRFACPFQKHNSQASPHCSQPSRRNDRGGFENVHRVKQHVLKVHNIALFCYRCWRRWETPKQAREHEEAASCEVSLTGRTDWMKPGQEDAVRERIASKDPEDRWYTLFERLFPHLPSEGPESAREKYSPYYQAVAGSFMNCNMSSDESILSSSAGLFLDEPFAFHNPPPLRSTAPELVATQEPSNHITAYSEYYTTDWLDGFGDANAFNARNTMNPSPERPSEFSNSANGNDVYELAMMNPGQEGSLPTGNLPSVQNGGQLATTDHADLRLHLSNTRDELRRRGSKIDRCITAYSKLSTCLDDMSDFAIELASNPADANRVRTLNGHIKLMREVLANVF